MKLSLYSQLVQNGENHGTVFNDGEMRNKLFDVRLEGALKLTAERSGVFCLLSVNSLGCLVYAIEPLFSRMGDYSALILAVPRQIIFSAGSAGIYPLAFLFGCLAVVASYLIARVYRTTPTIMLILGGTIVSSVFSALISLMKYVADPTTQLPNLVYWLMGSLASAGWEQLAAALPIIIGIVLLFIMSWRINVLSMGDKEARSMGVDVVRDKLLVVAGATLATAGAICISGVVGWVGLIIPHVGRMICGSDNRRLLPLATAIGASFMLVIDLVARTMSVSEVPLGVLTALIGAPFFV